MLHPDHADVNWALGIAFLANLLSAFSQLCAKRLTHTEETTTILFYENALPAAVSVGLAFWFWTPQAPQDWWLYVGVGILGVFSQFSLLRAIRLADVSFVAPYEYLRMVFALPISFFIFQETPSWPAITGGCFILLSSAYLSFWETLSKKRQKQF
jgi:drug/metabolite transporter (DMT)-like permease